LPVSSTGMHCYISHVTKSPFLCFGKEKWDFLLLEQGPGTFLEIIFRGDNLFNSNKKGIFEHLSLAHGYSTKEK
jgi:hypothetical protein